MTDFFSAPGVLDAIIEGTRTRAVSAGIDPAEYATVTAELHSLEDWQPHLRARAHAHSVRAEGEFSHGDHRVAAESHLTAALWSHFATTIPGPDRDGHIESAQSYRTALQGIDPGAEWIHGPDFLAVLRRPALVDNPPLALVVPGLDSSITEFHTISEALLSSGVATLAIDGPGQGELAPLTSPTPDYHLVIRQVLDALGRASQIDTDKIGILALSLGGYYGAMTLAHEPRVSAGVLVSGPSLMTWAELPPFVTHTLSLRTGSEEAAQVFADRIDLSSVAASIEQPVLVVDGDADVIPGIVNGEPIAADAELGEYLSIPGGDHLVANARAAWLPPAVDWLTRALS